LQVSSTLLCLLCLMALASRAASLEAADGALEINQACALNGGCFSGDSAGFPVTIDGSAGKSYRLTGDLDLSSAPNLSGIIVTGANVTLDMGGFEIAGPITCTSTDPTLDCGAAEVVAGSLSVS